MVLDRFLNYVKIHTTSDSSKDNNPSTERQKVLAELLVQELRDLKLDEVYYDEKYCYVYGLLKGKEDLPKIGFLSHMDTSPAVSGENVKPNIIKNYDGSDIELNGIVLKTSVYPDLKNHVGKTLITSDGTTLLGADDKAGIAEIMEMLEYFSSSSIEHGDIYVCFTPDEEIGLGTKNLDKNIFKPDFAYTVDGIFLGEFSYENFNACKVEIDIDGISTHTGNAKGIMVNACHIGTIFNSLVPLELPSNTDGKEGFYHLDLIEGDVVKTKMIYLIRDFDKENFEKRKNKLLEIADKLNKEYGNCIEVTIIDLFKNMLEVVEQNKDLIDKTIQAIKDAGVKPLIEPIRGGTDGANISYNGIPCPNLGAGGHNFHSLYEYVCLEDMEQISKILIKIVEIFSK